MNQKSNYQMQAILLLSLFASIQICADQKLLELDKLIVPVLDAHGIDWRTDWHYISYLCMNEIDNSLCFRTYPFTTINNSGSYKLASDVANQITISASNVTLDLNGHTVNGGAHGIVIGSGLNNITVKNGTIDGVSDGIQINTGCSDITITNVAAKNCLRGIKAQESQNAVIRNCDLITNTTGIECDTSHNIYVENCVAQANVQAGFSLVSSTTCTFQNCKALSTGDGNTSTFGDTSNVFGFVTSNGYGNLFENCIANSTQALTTTDANSVVAGFGFRGSEGCSKIISCQAANSMTSPTGVTVPYGIWLEPQFDGLTTVTSINPDQGGTDDIIHSVDWSPDGRYLAVGGFIEGATGHALFLYEFDRTTGDLIQLQSIAVDEQSGNTIRRVTWSADGNYLAAGGAAAGGVTDNALFIYKFDRNTKMLTQIIAANPVDGSTNDLVLGLAWSPDGNYLAGGGIIIGSPTNDDLFIYRFDKVAQTLTQIVAINPGGGADDFIFSVAWSPDGKYLAAVGATEGVSADLFLYSFNRSTESVTQIVAVNPDEGATDDELVWVDWSPDGNYLAIGGVINGVTNNDVFVYQFDQNAQTLTPIVSINPEGGSVEKNVRCTEWSPDGNYLAVGVLNLIGATNTLFVYKFDKSAQTLTEVAAVDPGGSGADDQVFSTIWSPDGQYLAICGIINGATTNNDVFVYRALQFPQNNIISNNTVYCNSGNQFPNGVGICGSSISNLIIGNVAYADPLNSIIFGSSYQFVTNIFNASFSDAPTKLQNIELNNQPIPSRYNIPAMLNRLEVLAESLIDNLL